MRLRTKGATALVSALIADRPTERLVTTALDKPDATPDRIAARFCTTSLFSQIALDNNAVSIVPFASRGLASQYLTSRLEEVAAVCILLIT